MPKISHVDLKGCLSFDSVFFYLFLAFQNCRATCASGRRGGCLILLLHIHKAKKKEREYEQNGHL